MIIVNRSTHDDVWLRTVLEAGAAGFADARVTVIVQDKPWSGCAYNRLLSVGRFRHHGRCPGPGCYLIEVNLPADISRPVLAPWRSVTLDRKYPAGVPLESPADRAVYLAAHEFRHVWQYRKELDAIRRGKTPRRLGELDADRWAISRLNRWRVVTGRSAIEAVKQPNPFINQEVSVA